MEKYLKIIFLIFLQFSINSCEERATCQTGEWQCFDGGCIPGEAKCDNYPHCEDESDEQNCGTTVCNEGLVECRQPDGSIGCQEDPVECAVCPAPTTNREDIELWEGSRGTAWFKADDIVYYRCSEFYIPAGGSGIGISTCNSDGSWTSFSLDCRARECNRLEAPINGHVVVASYQVGGVAIFHCDHGYEIKGHTRALCMSNGEFEPSEVPECEPVMCSRNTYLRNGNIQHINQGRTSFSFGTTNQYSCKEGYRVEGPSSRRCLGNGEWEGEEPYCREIRCAEFGTLYNGKIRYTKKSRRIGSLAIFSCNVNSDMVPDTDVAICLETEEWSENLPQCLGKAQIGTMPKGRVYIGKSRHPVRSRTTVAHRTRVRQVCDGTSELYSTAEQRYLNVNNWHSVNENGTWTPALSECVIKRCETSSRPKRRFEFTNGTATHDKVDYDTTLHTYCIKRYDFEDEFQETPAVARCGTGGYIRGAPRCVPAFCNITLDRTLYLDRGTASQLVDDIGRIASGTKVFFRCSNSQDNELFLDDYIDEMTDTCSFGEWTKKRLPVCKEKRCYLRVYRGASFSDLDYGTEFRKNTFVESQTDVQISCMNGFRLVDENNHPVTLSAADSYSSCLKGKWVNVLKCKPEPCQLAYDDSHMKYKRGAELVTTGSEVKDGQTITASCEAGFKLKVKENWLETFSAACSEGKWSEKVFPECIEVPCSLSVHKGSNYWTIDEGNKQFIHTSVEIPSDTRVYIGCHDGYHEVLTTGKPVPGENKYSECRKGVWNPIYQCKPKPCTIPPNNSTQDGVVRYYQNTKAVSQRKMKHGSTIAASCETGYMLQVNETSITSFSATCSEGKWSEEIFPECVEQSCKLLLHSGSDYWTTVEGTRHAINTSVEIPSNTRVYIGCHDGYEERLTSGEPVPEDNKYSVCAKGEWTPIYQCKLKLCTIPNFPINNGYVKYYQTARVIQQENVTNGSTVIVKCQADNFQLSLNGEPIKKFISRCTLGTFEPKQFPSCILKPTEMNVDNQSSNKTVTERPVSSTEQVVLSTHSVKTTTRHLTTLQYTTIGEDFDGQGTGVTASEPTPLTEEAIDMAATIDNAITEVTEEAINIHPSTTLPPDDTAVGGECMLPSNPNLKFSDDYEAGSEVLNGKIIMVTCEPDLYESSIFIVCKDGTWNETMPDCTETDLIFNKNCQLDNGIFERLETNSTLFRLACYTEYYLNHAEFEPYKCQEGQFMPVFAADDTPAECNLPGNCIIPEVIYPEQKIQDDTEVYLSPGNTVLHDHIVTIICPETMEPKTRKFKCNAEKWRAVPSNEWNFRDINDSFPYCRPASCKAGCQNGGICQQDNECQCLDGTYGRHCQYVNCNAPDNVILQPAKRFYSYKDDNVRASCKKMSDIYRGPKNLRCLSDGRWLKEPVCEVPAVCQPECVNGGICQTDGSCKCPVKFYGPGCEKVYCDPQTDVHLRPNKYLYTDTDTEIVAHCVRPYDVLLGEQNLRCFSDGTWDYYPGCARYVNCAGWPLRTRGRYFTNPWSRCSRFYYYCGLTGYAYRYMCELPSHRFNLQRGYCELPENFACS